MAWINYINLVTVRAVERAREVGVRKVVGSQKRQLVLQFLAESFIMNAIAGVLAVIMFQVGFPFFRELAGQPLRLDMSDLTLWMLIGGLVVVGPVLSGIYPAFSTMQAWYTLTLLPSSRWNGLLEY